MTVSPAPLDVPDAELVAECDRANGDPLTNLALANELNHTRRQRDDCAARMDAIRKWREDAIRRHDIAAGNEPVIR